MGNDLTDGQAMMSPDRADGFSNRVALTAAIAIALTACSSQESSEQAAGSPDTSSKARAFDDSEVIEFLDATKDDRFGGDSDWIITLENGDTCDVTHILKSPSEIETYSEAGDSVATNSEGWMGIVIGSYEGATASCLDELNKRLASFE